MKAVFALLGLAALVEASPSPISVANPQAGGGNAANGVSTRYWDCCKPSCAWPDKANFTSLLKTCKADNSPQTDKFAQSGCNAGGTAFTCFDQRPFVKGGMAYGFSAVNLSGQTEGDWCCSCYEIEFTSAPVAGQKMIVQATNTGGDLGSNHFDLMIPGGGMGIFTEGCPKQGEPNQGKQYGGFDSASQCTQLKNPLLREGCNWRFSWFKGADNPKLKFRKVACPKILTDISGCVRADA